MRNILCWFGDQQLLHDLALRSLGPPFADCRVRKFGRALFSRTLRRLHEHQDLRANASYRNCQKLQFWRITPYSALPFAIFGLGILTLRRRFVPRELSKVTVRARIITSATGRFPVGRGCAATWAREPLDRERAAAKNPADRSLGGAIHRGHWQSDSAKLSELTVLPASRRCQTRD